MQVIEAADISKKYIIDHQKKRLKGYSLKEMATEKIKHLFGQGDEDEYEKEDFWALKDISFEVQQGDRVGIIGHNGAGKSTLLKILSKITEPSSGHIKIKGRVASLLEVGTGFHPELTGRENIFLNGAVLGMNKNEIKSAFDEIIDFAGVEKFLDTPVKRYSSGMYVRLGFAIAAHLNPEILIIDEVLAVGDAEFQKKCLGKMRDVSESGRTILFVSHNLTAVQALCNKALYLENGRIKLNGETNYVINNYLSHVATNQLSRCWEDNDDAPGNEFVRLRSINLVPDYQDNLRHIDVRTPIQIGIDFWNKIDNSLLNLSLHLFTVTGECVFNVVTEPQTFADGLISATLDIPGNLLNDESYIISLMIVKDTSIILFQMSEALSFGVEDYRAFDGSWYGKWPGYIRPQLNFQINQAEILA